MADIGGVLRDLRDEIISLMGAITIEELPDQLFEVHEPDDATPIEEQEGKARLFTVEIDDEHQPAGIGGNTDRSITPVTIAVQYPAGEKWKIAARSDYWLIVRRMIADQSFASGTCQRFVNVLEGFKPEPMKDGFLMRIPIHCIVEHD